MWEMIFFRGVGGVGLKRRAVPLHFFLALAGLVGCLVGCVAALFPAWLLTSKGISSVVAEVWVREIGVLLLAIGMVALRVRRHPDSPTLRAVLWGNALIQWGLLPIELWAVYQGVISNWSGVVPNTLIHLVLGSGFFFYARR